METSIFLLGNTSREEVKNLMQMCDVFVLTSKKETFGVVLIEAMSCGKPVISTKSGGPEYIINQNNGILCKNSIEDISRALYDAKSSIKDFDHKKIRDHVKKSFSPEKFAHKALNDYLKIIHKS